MKLLICTQAVDLDDPVLGFFHGWLAEFAKHCEVVHVVCLREGRHELPKNIFVHSLGKPRKSPADSRGIGKSLLRMKYVWNFYRYIRKFRNDYDAVFVHMNPEYLVLGGLLWRLWRKPSALWYVHWSVNMKLRIAVAFSNAVFSATGGSFKLRTRKLHVVGHGIDTDAFVPGVSPPAPDSILFLGRIDPTKRPQVFLLALQELHEEGVRFSADLVGSSSEEGGRFAHDVRNLASPLVLEGPLSMIPAVTNKEARAFFSTHAIFCNLSAQGHFDKTLLEAMASGCIVVSTNDEMKGLLPAELIPKVDDISSTANALRSALRMEGQERAALRERSREWVVRQHSLSRLIPNMLTILKGSGTPLMPHR